MPCSHTRLDSHRTATWWCSNQKRSQKMKLIVDRLLSDEDYGWWILLPVAMEPSVVCGFGISPFGPLMGYGFFLRWLEKHPRSVLIEFQHHLRPSAHFAFNLPLDSFHRTSLMYLSHLIMDIARYNHHQFHSLWHLQKERLGNDITVSAFSFLIRFLSWLTGCWLY